MNESLINNEQLLSKKQAAAFCGVSQPTITRWMKKNKISYIKIVKRVLFCKDQLIEDLKKFTVPAEN